MKTLHQKLTNQDDNSYYIANAIVCDVMDYTQLDTLLHNVIGANDDYTLYLEKLNILFTKFKYADGLNYEFKYIVLHNNTDIFGLIKFKKSYYTENNIDGYGIWYISLNQDYIGNGLSKMLVDKLFQYAKQTNMALYPSYFSVDGYTRIRKYFAEFEQSYDVKCIYVLGLENYLENHFIKDLLEYNSDIVVMKISNFQFMINDTIFIISDYFLDKASLIKPNDKYILIEVNRNDINESLVRENIIKYIHINDVTSLPYKIYNILYA